MQTPRVLVPPARPQAQGLCACQCSEGGMIRFETLIELKCLNSSFSNSNFSIRAFRAYPLIETRQMVPCRAIRGNSISVNSALPPSQLFSAPSVGVQVAACWSCQPGLTTSRASSASLCVGIRPHLCGRDRGIAAKEGTRSIESSVSLNNSMASPCRGRPVFLKLVYEDAAGCANNSHAPDLFYR